MSGFYIDPARLPRAFDPARAERLLADLASAGFPADGPVRALLQTVFGNSPYLGRLALRHTELLRRLFAIGPESLFEDTCRAALTVGDATDEISAMSALRRAKAEAALIIALADVAGVWPLEQVTAALTRFADAALKGALRFSLAAASVDMKALSGVEREQNCGLVLLAMGKYGAFELNYSSDIDIVVFFDAERFPLRKFGEPRAAAVGIVKQIVRLIGQASADGYVFRVDLRLRPDAGSTQIAISLDAAAEYYEEMGQNWERAAMIKARAAAGDPDTAAQFFDMIQPFVWRRSLDFAAIEDVHAIKRQIHAVYGGGDIAVAGHNVKLGRGGIREIEFFVQTQQLILGGRDPLLRSVATLEGLRALTLKGVVEADAEEDLVAAYRFLRTLEHRLQMVEDQQTHSIGKTDDSVEAIAAFMGFSSRETFSECLLGHLRRVQSRYARLFEQDGQSTTPTTGSLVFTGVEDDEETLKNLIRMGFSDPSHISGAIRAWHHGAIRATRSRRARELLTKLIPELLEALGATAAPDTAFAQFDRFVTNLPAGVQLFSLLLAHKELLKLIADLMGSAPRLAQHLSHAPATLDALFDADFFRSLPLRPALEVRFGDALARAGDYERQLDELRRLVKENIFRVGVQVIMGLAPAEEAGPAFAAIAESAVAAMLPFVEAELNRRAGHVPGGAFAVIAMGKLGGREMTAASDLDLVFVYDAPEGVEESIGEKPLPVMVYYARLAQRLIAALTTMTSVGGLYEVDMRLRPSGNKGPAAVRLTSFNHYHAEEAWTWERLAMTRARVIAGPPALSAALNATITKTLCRPQSWDQLAAETVAMRVRVAEVFPGDNAWDLKYTPGGLMDLEFLAQALQLKMAPTNPGVLSVNTVAALRSLAEVGALKPAEADVLIEAAGLQGALMQALRIALDGALDSKNTSPGLRAILAKAGGETDFSHLSGRLRSLQGAVHAIFTRILGGRIDHQKEI